MQASNALAALAMSFVLSSCSTAKFGDRAIEARLKNFEPLAGRVSLYLCREPSSGAAASFQNAEALVNGRTLGAIDNNTFAHTDLPPGRISTMLKRDDGSNSGLLELQGKAGDVLFVWVGARPFTPLLIDSFTNPVEGQACVREARYVVP